MPNPEYFMFDSWTVLLTITEFFLVVNSNKNS